LFLCEVTFRFIRVEIVFFFPISRISFNKPPLSEMSKVFKYDFRAYIKHLCKFILVKRIYF